MVATRRQKQVLLVANPLRDAGILQQVLNFLPGNWLFLGAVCREWRTIYSRALAEDQQVRSFSLDDDMLVTCDVTTTLCSAALISPARARLAYESGLQLCTEDMQVNAGLHADVPTLTTLCGSVCHSAT
jgi:hypothetical protein